MMTPEDAIEILGLPEAELDEADEDCLDAIMRLAAERVRTGLVTDRPEHLAGVEADIRF